MTSTWAGDVGRRASFRNHGPDAVYILVASATSRVGHGGVVYGTAARELQPTVLNYSLVWGMGQEDPGQSALRIDARTTTTC